MAHTEEGGGVKGPEPPFPEMSSIFNQVLQII